jgi:predicted nucleic acid-binding OB-fold protein
MIEEWAYVLDILPNGRPEIRVFKPVAQVIGEIFFTILEVIP